MPVADSAGLLLHRATPARGVGQLLGGGGAAPYWAFLWAGGLALVRHLQEHPGCVSGRRVVDLGAGSGIVGIAAARAGAARVCAIESDPLARAAIPLNAALNGVAVDVLDGGLADDLPGDIDLILAGDVFYDPATATAMIGFLDRAAAAGIDVLVGDPARAPLPRERLGEIARYEVAETDGRRAPGMVYRFCSRLSRGQDILAPSSPRSL